MRRAVLAAFVAALWTGAAVARTETVVDLEPRPGVSLRYLALSPEGPPKAAVMLLIGGFGVLDIPDRPDPNWRGRTSPLSRARELFRRHGLFVALVDAPTDYKGGAYGLAEFRLDAAHARDLAFVATDMRRRAPGVSLWAIGHSSGTMSAANFAAHLPPPQGPDGLVLAAAQTQQGRGLAWTQQTMFSIRLRAIAVPTLVVWHARDGCFLTPPSDAGRLRSWLSGAPRTEVIILDGGDPPRGEACAALNEHGFLGVERQFVAAIVGWMMREREAR